MPPPSVAKAVYSSLLRLARRLDAMPLSKSLLISQPHAVFDRAARHEILRDLRLRRLHITFSVLAAALFVVQGITGSRDLLEIPLSWQKPAVYACDFEAKVCPAPPQGAS